MTITIPANGRIAIPVNGKYFTCHSSTTTFLVALGNEAERSVSGGQVIESVKKIRSVSFRDTSGSDCAVVFEVGEEKININPQVTAGAINVATALIVPAAVVPVEGIYQFVADDTAEQILPASTAYFTQIIIYPASAASGGLLTANTMGDIYAGLSATYQPDKRATTDTNYPIVIEPPMGKIAVSRVRVQGKIGDGVFYRYLPS